MTFTIENKETKISATWTQQQADVLKELTGIDVETYMQQRLEDKQWCAELLLQQKLDEFFY